MNHLIISDVCYWNDKSIMKLRNLESVKKKQRKKEKLLEGYGYHRSSSDGDEEEEMVTESRKRLKF